MNWKYLLLSLAVLTSAQAANYDLIIRGGNVVDGTGLAAFRAEVAVKDGRIVAIGQFAGDAEREVKADGLVVAPGFIDVHTHVDSAHTQPLAENYVRMGVTSLVTGNCGGSVRDVGAYLSRLETNTVSINIATLIGHGTVRSRAMGGSFNRPPTEAELAKMKSLVEQAMRDGGVGWFSGFSYLPGIFAKTDEII